MRHVQVDASTGEIRAILECDPQVAALNAPDGMLVVQDSEADPDRHYYDGAGVRREKGVMPVEVSGLQIAADGIEQIRISGVPQGTLVYFPHGAEVPAPEDGQIRYSTQVPGLHRIVLRNAQFFTEMVDFHAVNPE